MPTESDTRAILVDGRDPRRIFAAGSGGVFSSTDAGQSWKMISGLPKTAWAALGQDPRHPENLFALAANGTLVRSENGGETWRPVQ